MLEEAPEAIGSRKIWSSIPTRLPLWAAIALIAACLPPADELRNGVPAPQPAMGGAGGGLVTPGGGGRPAVDAAPVLRLPDAAVAPPPPPVTASRCAQWAAAFCARLAACNAGSLQVSYGTETRCRERRGLYCDTWSNFPGALWPTPACIAAFARLTCADFVEFKEPLECLSPGMLPDGAACTDQTQCQGRRCLSVQGQACGRCARREAAGGLCASDLSCQWGLVCSEAKTCVAPGALGAACDDKARPCRSTFRCRGGVCVDRGQVGAACADGRDCNFYAGLGCNSAGKCARVVSSPSTCRSLADGSFEFCAASGVCTDATLMCVPAAADGAACNEERGPDCVFPASCTNGTCRLPSPNRACGAMP